MSSSNHQSLSLMHATLQWRGQTPYSEHYDDIYFSKESGVAESDYVFVQGNDLERRWRSLTQGSSFVLAETGFGTGLNFLLTVQHWLQTAPADATLHYISVEKHPFSRADLASLWNVMGGFETLLPELLAAYPPLVAGHHSRTLYNRRVTLHLLLGDALACLSGCDARVDAWYLDGFAPARNSDLWVQPLFERIAALSQDGTTFATFTAAGSVRRGLQQVGFRVDKRAGFGKKREMLHGVLAVGEQSYRHRNANAPWFDLSTIKAPEDKSAIIIGAGLAGISVAHALAQRGWRVQLLESGPEIAAGASGNPAGVVLPRLSADMDNSARFYLSAFLYTVDWLRQLKQRLPDLPWWGDGVDHYLSDAQQQRLMQLRLPAEIATQAEGCLRYPLAGWLSPRDLCQALLEEGGERVTLRCNAQVSRLSRLDHQWQVETDNGKQYRASTLIVANGYQASRLPGLEWLEISGVRGQISYLPAGDWLQLTRPVCYQGYLLPAHKGAHCLGATYDRDELSLNLRGQDHSQNRQALATVMPNLNVPDATGGRAAIRGSSIDHMPVVGPVPDRDFYDNHYADLHKGKRESSYPVAQYQPGLFVNAGHGSRGLVTCPYSAQLIAAQVNNEPLPIEQSMSDLLHPGRFLIRRYKRPE